MQIQLLSCSLHPWFTFLCKSHPTGVRLANCQIFDPYGTQTFNNSGFNPQQTTAAFSHFNAPHQQTHSQLHHSLFDPRAYAQPPGASSFHPFQLLSLDHPVNGGAGNGGEYLLVPKSEETMSWPMDFVSWLGLNLGGRTYFSSVEDEFVNRLYRRSRPAEPGSANSPRCQAEGCNADLTHAKHYHRRHKVCEFHSKASIVIVVGLTQRCCQQCSRLFRRRCMREGWVRKRHQRCMEKEQLSFLG